jgi:hypothetical protein
MRAFGSGHICRQENSALMDARRFAPASIDVQISGLPSDYSPFCCVRNTPTHRFALNMRHILRRAVRHARVQPNQGIFGLATEFAQQLCVRVLRRIRDIRLLILRLNIFACARPPHLCNLPFQPFAGDSNDTV